MSPFFFTMSRTGWRWRIFTTNGALSSSDVGGFLVSTISTALSRIATKETSFRPKRGLPITSMTEPSLSSTTAAAWSSQRVVFVVPVGSPRIKVARIPGSSPSRLNSRGPSIDIIFPKKETMPASDLGMSPIFT